MYSAIGQHLHISFHGTSGLISMDQYLNLQFVIISALLHDIFFDAAFRVHEHHNNDQSPTGPLQGLPVNIKHESHGRKSKRREWVMSAGSGNEMPDRR